MSAAILCASGCEAESSGRLAAQQVARSAVGQLVTYEEQVQAKVTAVNEAYDMVKQDMISRAAPGARNASRVNIGTAVLKTESGFMSTSAAPTSELIRAFAAGVTAEYRAAHAADRAERDELEQHFGEQMIVLDVDSAALKGIRKQLEPLQLDLSDSDRRQRAYAVFKTVQQNYEQTIHPTK